jgi:hypothetical protein
VSSHLQHLTAFFPPIINPKKNRMAQLATRLLFFRLGILHSLQAILNLFDLCFHQALITPTNQQANPYLF